MQESNQPTRILRLPEVKARTGFSRSMIYLQMKESRFPQSISVVGTRCVAWVESEVEAWIAEKIKHGRKPQTLNRTSLSF